jgi:hypothetical protein
MCFAGPPSELTASLSHKPTLAFAFVSEGEASVHFCIVHGNLACKIEGLIVLILGANERFMMFLAGRNTFSRL